MLVFPCCSWHSILSKPTYQRMGPNMVGMGRFAGTFPSEFAQLWFQIPKGKVPTINPYDGDAFGEKSHLGGRSRFDAKNAWPSGFWGKFTSNFQPKNKSSTICFLGEILEGIHFVTTPLLRCKKHQLEGSFTPFGVKWCVVMRRNRDGIFAKNPWN